VRVGHGKPGTYPHHEACLQRLNPIDFPPLNKEADDLVDLEGEETQAAEEAQRQRQRGLLGSKKVVKLQVHQPTGFVGTRLISRKVNDL
jgi:hypothetical protein